MRNKLCALLGTESICFLQALTTTSIKLTVMFWHPLLHHVNKKPNDKFFMKCSNPGQWIAKVVVKLMVTFWLPVLYHSGKSLFTSFSWSAATPDNGNKRSKPCSNYWCIPTQSYRNKTYGPVQMTIGPMTGGRIESFKQSSGAVQGKCHEG